MRSFRQCRFQASSLPKQDFILLLADIFSVARVLSPNAWRTEDFEGSSSSVNSKIDASVAYTFTWNPRRQLTTINCQHPTILLSMASGNGHIKSKRYRPGQILRRLSSIQARMRCSQNSSRPMFPLCQQEPEVQI